MAKNGKPQFTKIVTTSKHLALHWQSRRKTASDVEELTSHETVCPELPRPEFQTAMQAFLPFFLTIIGAPASWKESTKITGVSINKEEDGRRGVVLTASRKCPHGAAPIALNSPHLREQIEDKETGNNFFLAGMDQALDTLCEEAQAYLEGERSQGELFEGAEPKKERGKRGEPEKVSDIMSRSARDKARAD